jgi:hypothetical protein
MLLRRPRLSLALLVSLIVIDGCTTAPPDLPDPPAGLTYHENPAVYTVGVSITANAPHSAGGPVTSFKLNTPLPDGLTMNASTGVISGTPTTVQDAITYRITGSNISGSATVDLSITVNDVAPANLSYSAPHGVYTKGQSIEENVPSHTGGGVASYVVVDGALPAGLSLNPVTGVISGTPTAVTAGAACTIRATNPRGNTEVTLTLTVNDVPPAALSYATNPAVYPRFIAIPANAPHSTGGAVVSYSVEPALPTGLSLDTSTGILSGTPTVLSPSTSYAVTATNSGGSTTATLSLAVTDAPPSGLTYTLSNAVYTRGVAITPNAPSSSGGPVDSYAVSPALPAGLALNTATGVIAGTPTVLSTAPVTYTVTASNLAGSTTATVKITVNDVPPSGLGYSTNPAVYIQTVAIATNTPTASGGPVTSWTVSPALPAGLSLNTGSGAITGTPTAAKAATLYTVTATNSGGSATVGLTITVQALTKPINLIYSTDPAVYYQGSPIATNTPHSDGGPVVSWAVSPALPAGLSLSASTGVITGTPTARASAASYTVTATNAAGSGTATVSILVHGIATAGNLHDARIGHTATLIPNRTAPGLTGDVVVIAGGSTNATVDYYQPTIGFSWGQSAVARSYHTATLLDNQFVLVAGGRTTSDLTSTETGPDLYYKFGLYGNLATARHSHTATRLQDGRILLAGGDASGQTAELYTQSSNSSAFTGSLKSKRSGHTATLLSNGKVLIAGGNTDKTAELYDPATGTFAYTAGNMGAARSGHAATLLPDGRVLITGGGGATGPVSSAEVFDPASGTFSAMGDMRELRANHTATLLTDGKVLITGGLNSGQAFSPVPSTELYDPATGTSTPLANMSVYRYSHTATLLPNGDVLIVGGASSNTVAEIF